MLHKSLSVVNYLEIIEMLTLHLIIFETRYAIDRITYLRLFYFKIDG